MNLEEAIAKVQRGSALSETESEAVFTRVLGGAEDEVLVAQMLSALHQRGEVATEILGATRAAWAMRTPLGWEAPADAVDTCGTGGDGLHTFNVSTTVALAAAALGVPIVKHGNRAASSKSGSADVLQTLGMELETEPQAALRQLQTQGFTFLFAPRYHPGFKHVANVRKRLGHRTLFNLLGPLLNPAAVKRQVMGVYAPEWVEPVAKVFAARGHVRALVVHGGLPDQGTDELTTWGENLIAEVRDGRVRMQRLRASEIGLTAPTLSEVRGGDAVENAAIVRAVLAGRAGAAVRELTALNLAATLWAHGRGETIADNLGEALAFVAGDAGARHWRF